MRPSRAHCALTAAGSVGLSLFTQAGIAPQQLPTFFTAQSSLVRQETSSAGMALRTGGDGVLIGGGVVCPAGSPAEDDAQADGSKADRARQSRIAILFMRRLREDGRQSAGR
jgi:hypothetical protein